QRFQIAPHLLGSLRQFAAQNAELNIQTQQRLQYPVVEVARNAAALRFHRPRAETAQQKHILQRHIQVANNAFEPAQIAPRKWTPRIHQNHPSSRMAGRKNSYSHRAIRSQLLPRRRWRYFHEFSARTGSFATLARPGLPVVAGGPPKSLALPFERIPAHAQRKIFCQESACTRERQRFRRESVTPVLLASPYE